MPENFYESGIDPDTDFYNSTHLNIYGAQKISSHLGRFLQENYQLTDKRNNPDYEQWNINLGIYKNTIFNDEEEVMDIPEED